MEGFCLQHWILPPFSLGQVRSSLSSSFYRWNRYIYMLQLGDMRTSVSLQPDIVRFLSPLRILVPYFPRPTVAKYNESLSWFFALMDPAPGNRFPVFASVHWLVFMLNNLFPITFVFQPLLSPVSTPLPPLFDCVWSQKIRGRGVKWSNNHRWEWSH